MKTETQNLLCVIILVTSLFIDGVSSSRKPPDPCNRVCGGLSIPFPFGIGKDCYLNPWYEVVCDSSSVPFLSRINRELTRIPEGQPQVLGVDLEITEGNSTREGGCKVAFLTSEKYSSLNVTEPEQFHSDGYAVVELGWYFDTSDSRVPNPVGCMNVSDTSQNGGYSVETSCICSYGYFSGFSYRSCYCNSMGYTGNPFLPGGCVGLVGLNAYRRNQSNSSQ
ncbi:wall associated kinase-like 4 [Raphanus sativus]|nr:wall associated kinase-like 4 [Raphanus sativus]